jgi:hypothetical protein
MFGRVVPIDSYPPASEKTDDCEEQSDCIRSDPLDGRQIYVNIAAYYMALKRTKERYGQLGFLNERQRLRSRIPFCISTATFGR